MEMHVRNEPGGEEREGLRGDFFFFFSGGFHFKDSEGI